MNAKLLIKFPCVYMLVIAASCVSADERSAVSAGPEAQNGRKARFEITVQTVQPAVFQGIVFAGHTVWHCAVNTCSASIAEHRWIREECAALEMQVGRLSDCDGNVNGSLLTPDAHTGPDKKLLIVRDSSRFLLLKKHEKYVLEEIHQPDREIPADWLYSPKKDSAQETGVSTKNFYKQVQEFEIAPGLLGLHVASYDIVKEGSMQYAAGRDVFLVYDQVTHQVRKSGLPLVVTRSRYRSEGIWKAANQKYYVRDVNNDGYTDIGVMNETAICIPFRGPNIISRKITWYLYDNGSWKASRQYLKTLPTSSRHEQLPLVGLHKSPVQFVIDVCKPSASTHVKK